MAKRNLDVVSDADPADLVGPSASALVPTISADEAEELGLRTERTALDDDHFTKQLTLPPGVPLKARFAGYGGEQLVDDQNKKGVKRRCHSWLFKVSEALTYRVLGGSQMNTMLPHYPLGARITIVLNPDKQRTRKGNQVNDYMISDPKEGFLKLPTVRLETLDGEAGEVAE